MGTGSFPGAKRPGCGADHTPPSKCRAQERVGLYLYSPSGPSWPVLGAPLSLWTFTEFRRITNRTTITNPLRDDIRVIVKQGREKYFEQNL